MTRITLETTGDRQVTVTRRFAASPDALFRAHTEPDLIRRWMLGPPGWTLPVCDCDARSGGKMRYEFAEENGDGRFWLTGEFIALDRPGQIEHVERMHLPDPTPDNRIVTRFEPDREGTRMVMTMTLPDAGARAAMLASGMEHGMEASYERLEEVLADA